MPAILRLFALFAVVASVRVTVQQGAQHVTASDGEQQQAAASPVDIHTLAREMLTRQCVEEQAKAYQGRMSRVGTNLTTEESDHLWALITAYWALNDQRHNHLANYNQVRQIISRMRSSTIAQLDADLRNVSTTIANYGFNYDGVLARCEAGGSKIVQDCMVDLATKVGGTVFPELPALVSRVWELDDIHVHNPPGFDNVARGYLHQVVSCAGFDMGRKQTECERKCSDESQQIVTFLEDQVRNPAPEGECRTCPYEGQCSEKTDSSEPFCPEGLAVQMDRPFDAQAGQEAFATTYLLSWPIVSVVAPALGALGGLVTGGAVGAAAGFYYGNMFAQMPLYSLPMSAAAYAVFSTGPNTCMCFPRECIFSEAEQACTIELPQGASASRNPFGGALPFMSTKCVPVRKEEGRCEVAACEAADFMPSLGEVDDAPLFGKVGRGTDGGLYNCLSGSGQVTDAFLTKTHLPGSFLPNTAENRNHLFTELGIEERLGDVFVEEPPIEVPPAATDA